MLSHHDGGGFPGLGQGVDRRGCELFTQAPCQDHSRVLSGSSLCERKARMLQNGAVAAASRGRNARLQLRAPPAALPHCPSGHDVFAPTQQDLSSRIAECPAQARRTQSREGTHEPSGGLA